MERPRGHCPLYNGFRFDWLQGAAAISGGDVNGDGFDDVVADALTDGRTFVIFGEAPGEAVTRIGSASDQTIRGGRFSDTHRFVFDDGDSGATRGSADSMATSRAAMTASI